MSTLSLPMQQPREVSRRRLSLRRVEVAPQQPRREPASSASSASSAMATVRSAVAALPARLEALMRAETIAPAVQTTAPAMPLETLMQGATTLPILHNGEVYTLRITRYGKLILTK
ncbi:hemin uptake protein HemP [Cupriavidus plantarum]|uniref:hemin uptake protein HemP n=1 Tax=Cupriavidus plantarum TaxID=942865 RepID=UPI000EAFB27F|nr:hemin uptake protein HemP [Cupriavidus plantarum]RLK44674.1 hemin uptake protein hemP [Cupriavidus plantarum]